MTSLLDIESYLTGTFLIAAFVICSMGGVTVIRRVFELDRLRRHHDVSGNMFSVGGTLYAVLLGLVVVDAMQTFETARITVQKESDALANIFMLAEQLPAEKSSRIQALCKAYAADVINTEWPLLAKARFDPETFSMAFRLVRELADFEPGTENLKSVYPLLLAQALELRDERRTRISMALHGLPMVEWLVLCIGAVITVVFTYFFRLESYRVQFVMTGMVALLIALNLYLVVLFAHPFSGDLRVDPHPFIADLKIFEGLVDGRTHP
jgi:hypothetical protein